MFRWWSNLSLNEEGFRVLEVELKFPLADFGAVEERISTLGLTISPPVEESNQLFDWPDGRLGASGRLLRVRSADGRTILTVKTAVPDDTMKVRSEIETTVACPAGHLASILAEIGLSPVYSYSKIRRTCNAGPAVVCLDELWFGRFVEIESGSREGVWEAARLLGLDPAEGLASSYADLETLRGGDAR
jgi:adenylate cyclase, class 2